VITNPISTNIYNTFSTSSCNANALYPILKIIDDNYNILSGDIVTIHPLLNHQKTLDGGCLQSGEREVDCNFEFGRSSVFNLIPSNTTTIKAISFIEPKYQKILTSNSIRTPTDTVGVINVVLWLDKKTNIDELLDKLSQNKIIKINDLPLVSSDFKNEIYSIVDKRFIKVYENMVKLVIWYDNEMGYAKRVVNLIKEFFIKRISKDAIK
jgi:glyceraldehyde 3-phosphate dehydrogenase